MKVKNNNKINQLQFNQHLTMDFNLKELGGMPVVMDGQTHMECYSDNKLSEEGQGHVAGKDQKSTKYQLTKGDTLTLKLSKGLILYNLIGFVFLLLGCTIIYISISSNWSEDLLISLQLFLFSDILLIAEKIVFMASLINKKKLIKLCLLLNITAIQLKIIASGLAFTQILCALIVSLILFVLQVPHNVVIYIIVRRWKQIPKRKWKKQLILVRKPLPNVKGSQ